MPDHNDSMPAASARSAALEAAGPAERDDIALGWECANPALQIDRWQQETAAADAH